MQEKPNQSKGKEEKNMKCYETVVIYPATLGEEQFAEVSKKVESYFTKENLEIETRKFGRRTLAYPIKKHSVADYYIYRFKTDKPIIATIEERLKYNEDVLRYMTVRIPEKFFD